MEVFGCYLEEDEVDDDVFHAVADTLSGLRVLGVTSTSNLTMQCWVRTFSSNIH